ncbi:PREDICTED: uncharacterized protein LOC105127746 isoform X4 [Populus euphratica]|uniref:Uncharacterized protein LOC105127746 isoform X4 n=1 Tax=Populus euphratica TaxID=75702 RepID=A0AAJ6UDL5_POPEU|nr:PREDICTED: uncharacterized protein LOC105127746 isoform X4 [Populus euphratica]
MVQTRPHRYVKDQRIAATAMDPRSSYFHHTKYANPPSPTLPLPLPLPHPQPSLYRNNLNIHGHINFPAPPPPHPQQLRPPQTPQFSPRNPQFSYNHSPNHPQIHDNYHHQLSRHDLTHFTPLPRVSHQFNDDRQPPRRLPESDHRVHEPRPDFRVLRHDRQTRHELEGNPNPNSRLIQDRNIVIDRESEHYHIRGEFGSNSDRSSTGDFRTVSNQVRGFESNSGNYENRRRLNYDYHDKGSENQSWFRDREVVREPRDASIEFGSNEIDDGETRIATGKREHYRSREGNLEVERYGGKRSREGSYEFNRTPRKQVQKKSALLRIQQPSYRNREDERLPYSGYVDDTKSSSFRGKDQESGFFRGKDKDKVIHPDRGMGEGEREGSPVELDVSFKSNSLVAKAILTPSSSTVGASETILTPRNSKVRKVLVPAKDKDSINSSMNKPSKVAVEVGKGASVASKASSSDKDLKKTRERVIASGITNVRDSSSLPLKNRVEMPMKRTVAVRIGTPGKISSLSGKKKKVVKRVVKKVVSHNSTLSSSHPTKTRDEPVKGDSFAHTPAEPRDTDKAATVADVDSQPCPIEATVIPENDRVDRFEKFMESGQAGAGADSGNLFAYNTSGKKSCSRSPLGSSNHNETKFGEIFVNGDCAKALHAIPNIDNSLTKSLDEIISSNIGGVEDVSKQPCQNGDSCLLENSAVRGSLKVMDSIEGNTDFGLLSLEKTIIHEDPKYSCIPVMGLDVASINSQQRITVSDKGKSDVGCKEPCRNQGSSLAESGITDFIQGASFPVGSNEISAASISGETGSQNAVIRLNQGVGTILGSPNCFTNIEEIDISGHGTSDGMGEKLSQDGAAKIMESEPIRGSLDTKVSTSGSEEDANDTKKNDKKIEMPQSDLSRTDVPDMHLEPANMVTSTTAHWVDTTLRLCFEDDGTAQCTFSGAEFVDAGSQSCSNVVSVLHEGSLTDVSAAKVSIRSSADGGQRGVSQRNEKNRKSFAPQLELCSPVESDADEGPVFAGNSTSGMEVPSNSGDSLTLPKGEVVVSDMDSLCTSDLLLARKGITAMLENGSAGEHLSSVASVKDAFEVDGLKDVQSHLAVEELAVKKVTSHSLFVSVGEDNINTTPVMVGGRNQNDSMDIDAVEGAKVDIDAAEEQVGIESVTDHCQIPSKLQTQYLDGNMPSIDVDDGGFHGAKNDSPGMSNNPSSFGDGCAKNDWPGMSNNPSSFGDGFGVSFTNSGDELMEIVPETLSDRGSPETLPDVMGTSLSKNSVEKIHENDDKIPAERPVINVGSDSSMSISSSRNAKVVLNLDHAVERDQLLTGNTGHLPSQDSKITTQMPNAKSGDLYGKKNHSSNPISKIYSGRSSFVFTASKSSASSSRISKTRTWHRNDNCSDSAPPSNKAFSSTVPVQRQFPRKADKSQRTSYIRKGNSLVRKPTSVAQSPGPHALSSSVYQLTSSGTDEPKKSAGSDSRIDLADPLNVLRTGGLDASFEKPRTHSLSSVSKISNQASNSLGVRASSPLAEHLHSLCTETVTVPAKLLESNDIPKSSDDLLKISESPITQNSQISNLECHSDPNDGNTVALANVKSLTYVKRKSNQLVASSNPCASSVQNAHNTSSDSYYKRRKNQLIRTSLESQIKQTASIPDESLNSEGQTALNSFSRNFSKRRLRKVVTKTCKPSKLSLVWTLHGAQLSKDDGDSSRCGKVLPHLFPWKRAAYRRSSFPNSSSISDHSSLSTIGYNNCRKLLLLRKRNTEYTRSKHGFSLRKSKVLSVGGSSLKWSKSIEKHSKKANEEATLAVAAAERKKREQRGAARVACPPKNRNISRERIFRVGSVRYKMDSSRRTLQRISDDESSCTEALQKEKDAKKLYIPRRLMIGKDEYVRIGNGNQLIRDPKKRTRILASEKVRWSLHTARSRLARKRKYCQFFTRFGKCNKDDGKCPFIHDSSKIAVCTKFLNGLCFNPDCKLTHKVIPERMPDCSYFLQGLCTNKNCPYRHVHVNPNASTCEGFLRGYCADGNECPKKHSYVCPSFEAIGSCPQGSKCKLHHPKNRTKEKKSKRSRENNAQGRYFGLMHINATKTRNAVPGKLYVQDNDTIGFKGIADYISLDVSDEEVVENNNPGDLHTAFGDSDPLNLQLGDLDKLIKPVRIMNI